MTSHISSQEILQCLVGQQAPFAAGFPRLLGYVFLTDLSFRFVYINDCHGTHFLC